MSPLTMAICCYYYLMKVTMHKSLEGYIYTFLDSREYSHIVSKRLVK